MKQTRTENTPRSAAFNINILDILYFVSEKSGIGISTALIVVFCAWAPLFMVSCGGTSSDAASSLPLSAEEKQRLEHRLKQLSHDSLVVISNDSTNRFDILHRMLASRLLGLSKRHVSEFSEAINHTRRYLSLAYAAADTLEAERALNDLGTNFRRIGALSEASNFHHTALYLTNLCSDKTSFTARKNRAISLNGLGNINLTLKYLDEAKYYFKQALEIERELKSSVGMAINYANLGAVFHEECLHDSAVLYYGLSMEQNRQGKSILGLSLCHNNLGEVYEKMGNLDSAQVEYQRAYDLMADDPDRWHALLPYLSLGRIALNRGQGATAYRLLSRAKAEAEKIDAPEQMEAACELLHRYYLSIGDYKQALKLIGESHTWGKRVISEQQLNRFMESRVSYEQEKNRSEIDKLNRINEMQARKKAMIQQTSLIAIVSLVVIASLLFVIARLQTKRNRELREVNATKDKLLSIISHDLKSPVVAQKAVLDTIIGNYHAYDTPALLHYLNLFRCTSESQMHLIQNLLA